MDRPRPVDPHEECTEVLAHETARGTVRLEVDAIVFEAPLLSVDPHAVLLHPACEEGVRLLVHLDDGRVDALRRREPVRPEEDEEEVLETHFVDVLVHRDIRLDRSRLVLDCPAFDLHRDAEPLERLVDLLVDVRLLLRRVLRAVPRFVEVAPCSPRVERRVDGVLPVRRVPVFPGVFGIALRRTESTIAFTRRLYGPDHRAGEAMRWDKCSTARPLVASSGAAATPTAATTSATASAASPASAAAGRYQVRLEVAQVHRNRVRERGEVMADESGEVPRWAHVSRGGAIPISGPRNVPRRCVGDVGHRLRERAHPPRHLEMRDERNEGDILVEQADPLGGARGCQGLNPVPQVPKEALP